MSEPAKRCDQILDSAEKMARIGGYDGFSFRDIAKDIGIRAASVHYHFPGKADLCAAMIRRYTDRVMATLPGPLDRSSEPDDLLQTYVHAYGRVLRDDKMMCLCGMFGAQIAYLPDNVKAEVKRFFELNIDWLERLLERKLPEETAQNRRVRAAKIFATLEGGLIAAQVLNQPNLIDRFSDVLAQA